jgi:putative tryptophan/tyrosine transport system substrate-binding protein
VRRRTAIGVLAAIPFLAAGQGKPARIGFLYFASRKAAIDSRRYPAFLRGMSELGHVEGKSFVVEARFADGKTERLPALVAELVNARVDVIVAAGNPAIEAAYRAARTVPIVIAQSPDPVAQGWAVSLAKPGKNVTGLTSATSEIEIKLVEFVRAVVPGLRTVAVLSNPTNPSHQARVTTLGNAARKLELSISPLAARSAEEFAPIFKRIAQEGAQALIIMGDTYFLSQAPRLAMLSLEHRLPSAHTGSDYADVGGLLAFGVDIPDNFRRAAGYVDKILKGAKPAELPIERPRKYELVINLRTARALGLTISKTLQFQADRLID